MDSIRGADIKKVLTDKITEEFGIRPIWDEMKEGYKKPSFFVYFLNLQKVYTSRDRATLRYPIEVQYQGRSNLDALAVGERFMALIGRELIVKGKHLQVKDFEFTIENKNMWADFEVSVSTDVSRYTESEHDLMRHLSTRYVTEA